MKFCKCPADPRSQAATVQNNPALYGYYGVNGPIAFTMYVANSGTHGGSGCCWNAPNNWSGGSPAPSFDGVIYADSHVRLSDITDGTSNTLMVGEHPPSEDMNFGWWFAGWGYNGTTTGCTVLGSTEQYFLASGYIQNLNQTSGAATSPSPPCTNTTLGLLPGSASNPCDVMHYWSNHTGGANFLMADGSVKFLTYNINNVIPGSVGTAGALSGQPYSIFQALATRNGSEVFNAP